MTREEAIQILRTRIVPTTNWQEIHDALDMAIEALQTDMVRCKECKYRDPEDERCDHGAVNFLLRRTDNDYCSYGERKGGDDE